jgi:diguanylate cyclase (GGDEF)-like protein/PAS domain S-box-containing protein
VSLRANTYVALTGAAFLAVLLVFTATIYAGRIWVHSAERIAAAGAMRQAGREVAAEVKTLDSVAHDWGSWTDDLRFVQGQNPRFVADNDPNATLTQLNADALVILDVSGKSVAEAFSPRMAADPSAMVALRAATLPNGRLLAKPGGRVNQGVSGLLQTNDGAMLVAARPIATSAEKGPIGGTVVLVRLVDTALLSQIDAVSGIKVAALTPQTDRLAPDLKRTIFGLPASNPVLVLVQRPLDISGYLRLDGLDGRPALIFTSAMAPVDYDIAMRTLGGLIALILIGGVVWALVAYQAVDNASLSRMTWLRDSVAQITTTASVSARIALPSGATDEVSSVGAEVNAMLDALDASHQRVQASEEQRRVLVDNMVDAVFTLGSDGAFTFGNPAASRLTGRTSAQLVGMPYRKVLAQESVKDVAERLENDSPTGKGPLSVVFADRSGATCPVELSISPIRDDSGKVVATTWIARDVTERREFEDQLIQLANHDHLTGLFNRRRFEEEIAQRLEETRRRGDGGALLWLDVDHLKEVNDSFGHRVGDELLTHVASVLRERSREDHIVARLGGDEFAMLLPGADEEEAIRAATRITHELSNAVLSAGEHGVKVSASIGIALYPSQATSVEELLVRADVAMYRAKESGRGRACLFSPDEAWPGQLASRRVWADRLQAAIANQEFVAYAQPILDLRTGKVTAYELLVRLVGEDGKVVVPTEFLSVAEDLGLIVEIDRMMLRRAVALASDPEVRASGVKLFVNLSAKTLADSAFLMFVRSQLEESGVDPRQFGFELTETALVANMARAHTLIRRLRAMGCSFALDDFGSGFSSITYLRHMPVDRLKIDGSLVREMLVNDQDRHLVKAIIELSRCLDISVTGEYVENEATLRLLEASGADFAQGNFIGAPRLADPKLFSSGTAWGGVRT